MNFHLRCCIVLNFRPTGKIDTGSFFFSIWDHWSYPVLFLCFLTILPIFITDIYHRYVSNTNTYQYLSNFSFIQLQIWTASGGTVLPYLTPNGKHIFYPPRAGRWQGCRGSLFICARESGTCHCLCPVKSHSCYQLRPTFKSVPCSTRS